MRDPANTERVVSTGSADAAGRQCPDCGGPVDRVRLPGDATRDDWGGPVMVDPCECVVMPTWWW